MDTLLEIIRNPFVWGLGLGLLIAAFIWKSAFSAKNNLKREIRRLQEEGRDLLARFEAPRGSVATPHIVWRLASREPRAWAAEHFACLLDSVGRAGRATPTPPGTSDGETDGTPGEDQRSAG